MTTVTSSLVTQPGCNMLPLYWSLSEINQQCNKHHLVDTGPGLTLEGTHCTALFIQMWQRGSSGRWKQYFSVSCQLTIGGIEWRRFQINILAIKMLLVLVVFNCSQLLETLCSNIELWSSEECLCVAQCPRVSLRPSQPVDVNVLNNGLCIIHAFAFRYPFIWNET